MVEIFYQEIFGNFPEKSYIEYTVGSFRKRVFTDDIKTFLNETQGKNDAYVGLFSRTTNVVATRKYAFTNVLWVDIDFHKELDNNKTTTDFIYNFGDIYLPEILSEDNILKNYFAIVFSGRGIHIYYKFTRLTDISEFKKIVKVFKKHLENYFKRYSLQNQIDYSVLNESRILRVIGSINSKTKLKTELIHFNPKVTLSHDTWKTLDSIEKCKNYSVRFSTLEAFKLLNIEPSYDSNMACPNPDHDDNNPSFRYYPETDTFYCFTCQKYGDGIELLKLAKRYDLAEKYLEDFTVKKEQSSFKLMGTALYNLTAKGGWAKVFDPKTDKLINIKDYNRNEYRSFYVYDDYAFEITDYPSERNLRATLLKNKNITVDIPRSSNLKEYLSKHSELCLSVQKEVIFNHGINYTSTGTPIFYLNGKLFPYDTVSEYVKNVRDDIYSGKKVSGEYDLNEVFNYFKKDGNDTHIITFLWGISTTAIDIIKKNFGLFPLIIATGMRESGKTKLATMIKMMFGLKMGADELDTTPFALLKKIERYGTLPVHFDEYANKNKEKEHIELIKQASVEHPYVRERGNVAQETNKYYLLSPYIITGERNVYDSGLISRSIILNVGKNMQGRETDEWFYKWYKWFTDGKAQAWVENFLNNHWLEYRLYLNSSNIRMARKELKLDIIKHTRDFLIMKGLMKYKYLTDEELEDIIKNSDEYETNISSDMLTEIMTTTFYWDDFDPTIDTENEDIEDFTSICYFSTKEPKILMKTTKLMKWFNSYSNRRSDLSFSAILTAFTQSPYHIDKISRSNIKIYDQRLKGYRVTTISNAFIIRLTETNKDYFYNVLAYKYMRMGLDGKKAMEASEHHINSVLKRNIVSKKVLTEWI